MFETDMLCTFSLIAFCCLHKHLYICQCFINLVAPLRTQAVHSNTTIIIITIIIISQSINVALKVTSLNNLHLFSFSFSSASSPSHLLSISIFPISHFLKHAFATFIFCLHGKCILNVACVLTTCRFYFGTLCAVLYINTQPRFRPLDTSTEFF